MRRWPLWVRLLLAVTVGGWLSSHAVQAFRSLAPKTLLIYYSYPSAINGASSVAAAATAFGQYDYLVLGDGLEQPSHPDHVNTVAILANPRMARTTVFGYIDLGVITQNLSLLEIRHRIDDWRMSGADGVFFDDFGYDFNTTRDRQNAAVAYAHFRQMPVVVNAFRPEDAFGDAVGSNNPLGTKPLLRAGDFYLFESYQIQAGAFQTAADWRAKADVIQAFQQALPFGVLSITTNDSVDGYDAAKFSYAWYSALLDGHAATGWGEYLFSSDDASAPFRVRPSVNAGTAFTSGVFVAGPVVSRRTNAGTIVVNTSTHIGSFVP